MWCDATLYKPLYGGRYTLHINNFGTLIFAKQHYMLTLGGWRSHYKHDLFQYVIHGWHMGGGGGGHGLSFRIQKPSIFECPHSMLVSSHYFPYCTGFIGIIPVHLDSIWRGILIRTLIIPYPQMFHKYMLKPLLPAAAKPSGQHFWNSVDKRMIRKIYVG